SLPGVLSKIRARGVHRLRCLSKCHCRGGPRIEAFLREVVRGRLAVECLARHLQDRLIGEDGQVGACNFSDEGELGATSGLRACKILLESGVIQAANLAEQVELVRGEADADLEEPE